MTVKNDLLSQGLLKYAFGFLTPQESAILGRACKTYNKAASAPSSPSQVALSKTDKVGKAVLQTPQIFEFRNDVVAICNVNETTAAWVSYNGSTNTTHLHFFDVKTNTISSTIEMDLVGYLGKTSYRGKPVLLFNTKPTPTIIDIENQKILKQIDSNVLSNHTIKGLVKVIAESDITYFFTEAGIVLAWNKEIATYTEFSCLPPNYRNVTCLEVQQIRNSFYILGKDQSNNNYLIIYYNIESKESTVILNSRFYNHVCLPDHKYLVSITDKDEITVFEKGNIYRKLKCDMNIGIKSFHSFVNISFYKDQQLKIEIYEKDDQSPNNGLEDQFLIWDLKDDKIIKKEPCKRQSLYYDSFSDNGIRGSFAWNDNYIQDLVTKQKFPLPSLQNLLASESIYDLHATVTKTSAQIALITCSKGHGGVVQNLDRLIMYKFEETSKPLPAPIKPSPLPAPVIAPIKPKARRYTKWCRKLNSFLSRMGSILKRIFCCCR